MNNGEISVTQALNQIQSWLNQGNYEKVIQGCQEILMLEPGNARALALLKRAEDKRFEEQQSGTSAEASVDPLKELEVEAEPEVESPEESEAAAETQEMPEFKPRQEHLGGHLEKRRLFMALVVPAVLVIAIGGAGIAFMNSQNRNEDIQNLGFSEDLLEQIEEEIEVEEPVEVKLDYLEQNQIRVETLTDLGKAIEEFKEEEGRFPSADEIEEVILSSKYFDELPLDPRDGEIDKRGNEYGYIYGTYTDGQGNDYYSMSAMFEDSRGFAYPWNRGVSPRIFSDYRDLDNKNVTKLGND